MINVHGCMGGFFFSKYDIRWIRCKVNYFFQQKLVIVVLEIFRRLGLETDAKFIMFEKTWVLLWYLVGSCVSENAWDLWSNWGSVNERSNGDRIIFKPYKHKINSRQLND